MRPGAQTGDLTIVSGAGADNLTGGAGADAFVFKAVADSQPGAGNFDTITGFTHGSDHIDVSAIAGLNVLRPSISHRVRRLKAPYANSSERPTAPTWKSVWRS